MAGFPGYHQPILRDLDPAHLAELCQVAKEQGVLHLSFGGLSVTFAKDAGGLPGSLEIQKAQAELRHMASRENLHRQAEAGLAPPSGGYLSQTDALEAARRERETPKEEEPDDLYGASGIKPGKRIAE